jgi:hypothetical protein
MGTQRSGKQGKNRGIPYASIRFIINKIEILKKLAACNTVESPLFRDFKLKQRIFNIKQRLAVIAIFLREELKAGG